MNVMVLNSGSSSLKFQVIATDLERIKQHKDDRICRGEVEGIGGEAIIRVRYRDQPGRTLTASLRDIGSTLDYLVRYIASDRSGVTEIRSTADVHAVGHRCLPSYSRGRLPICAFASIITPIHSMGGQMTMFFLLGSYKI